MNTFKKGKEREKYIISQHYFNHLVCGSPRSRGAHDFFAINYVTKEMYAIQVGNHSVEQVEAKFRAAKYPPDVHFIFYQYQNGARLNQYEIIELNIIHPLEYEFQDLIAEYC